MPRTFVNIVHKTQEELLDFTKSSCYSESIDLGDLPD